MREVIYKGDHRIITQELIEIFNNSYEVVESGCWIWKGRRDHDGYGVISHHGVRWRAHVLSYLIHNATEITVDNPQVRHACDDPPCVWGLHLQTGTSQDDANDRVERGRTAKGDKNGARTHPEKMARGDEHYSRTNPEKMARGDRHGMYGQGHLVAGDKNGMYGRTGEQAPMYGADHSGEKNGNAKLTEVDVRLIRKLKAEGHGPTHIARTTGLPHAAVVGAYQGRTWKNLL